MRDERFNLENAIASWRHVLRQRGVFSRDDLEELENHLRDHIDDLLEAGHVHHEAFDRAIARMGDHGRVETEFRKVRYGRSKRKRSFANDLRTEIHTWSTYARLAARRFRRHKLLTGMNVGGLAVGLASAILIGLFIRHELSYDTYHPDSDRIFRVVLDRTDESGDVESFASSYAALGPAMLHSLPEVEAFTRILKFGAPVFTVGGRQFYAEGFTYVDSTFFDLFDYPVVEGDPHSALARPYMVVLTETVARRYFGETDPLGQTITNDNGVAFEVGAIVDDPPSDTHLPYDVFASMATHNDQRPGYVDNQWRVIFGYTYVRLSDAAAAQAVEAILPAVTEPHLEPTEEASLATFDFALQPLTSIHLRSDRSQEIKAGGSLTSVTVLGAIGVFMLLIACFNVANLTAAQAASRSLEAGVRRVVGAQRLQLGLQFFTESLLTVAVAMLLSLVIVVASMPFFNALSGISLRPGELLHLPVAFGIAGIAALAAFGSGSYPAALLSRFRPLDVFGGGRHDRRSGARMLKGMVVVQFSLSLVLIVGALVVSRQMTFLQNTPLGFDREDIVILDRSFRGREDVGALRQDLLRHSSIKNAAFAHAYPTNHGMTEGYFVPEGSPTGESRAVSFFGIDGEYLPLLGIEIAAGRNLGSAVGDSTAVLINQKAVVEFGWKDPIGKRLYWPDGQAFGRVVGIVKDFHTESLRQPIQPIVLWNYWNRWRVPLVKIDGRNRTAALKHLRNVWDRHIPDHPFAYTFLSDAYEALYGVERRFSTVVHLFTLLAGLIACLGLFALSAFATQRRTKEIGIRKAVGATARDIVWLISSDFLRLVALAVAVGVPVGILATRRWLEDFAYHTEIGPDILAVAAGIGFVGALATVSYHALRAGRMNPVDSLHQ